RRRPYIPHPTTARTRLQPPLRRLPHIRAGAHRALHSFPTRRSSDLVQTDPTIGAHRGDHQIRSALAGPQVQVRRQRPRRPTRPRPDITAADHQPPTNVEHHLPLVVEHLRRPHPQHPQPHDLPPPPSR